MKVAPVADVKAKFSAYLERVQAEGPIVITRNGRVVAVLLAPADDDDLERILIARSPRFQALLCRSRKSMRDGRGLSHKEFWKTVKERSAQRRSGEQAKKGPRSM